MPLGTWIAGRYTGVYDSSSLGIMQDGFEIVYDHKEQEINRSDAFGDSLIDTIARGGNWSIQYEAMEAWLTGVKRAVLPYASNLGELGTIGTLGSAAAKALVLTATAGTPAAASPASLTATLCKLAPNSQTSVFRMNSVLRTMPVRMVFLPYDVSGTVKHFSTT